MPGRTNRAVVAAIALAPLVVFFLAAPVGVATAIRGDTSESWWQSVVAVAGGATIVVSILVAVAAAWPRIPAATWLAVATVPMVSVLGEVLRRRERIDDIVAFSETDDRSYLFAGALSEVCMPFYLGWWLCAALAGGVAVAAVVESMRGHLHDRRRRRGLQIGLVAGFGLVVGVAVVGLVWATDALWSYRLVAAPVGIAVVLAGLAADRPEPSRYVVAIVPACTMAMLAALEAVGFRLRSQILTYFYVAMGPDRIERMVVRQEAVVALGRAMLLALALGMAASIAVALLARRGSTWRARRWVGLALLLALASTPYLAGHAFARGIERRPRSAVRSKYPAGGSPVTFAGPPASTIDIAFGPDRVWLFGLSIGLDELQELLEGSSLADPPERELSVLLHGETTAEGLTALVSAMDAAEVRWVHLLGRSTMLSRDDGAALAEVGGEWTHWLFETNPRATVLMPSSHVWLRGREVLVGRIGRDGPLRLAIAGAPERAWSLSLDGRLRRERTDGAPTDAVDDSNPRHAWVTVAEDANLQVALRQLVHLDALGIDIVLAPEPYSLSAPEGHGRSSRPR